MIDVAVKTGVPYIQNGVNWYEGDPWYKRKPADARDPFGKAFNGIKKSMKYGEKKGVKVMVYVDDKAMEKFGLETFVEAYANWGAAGIMHGFMDGSRAHQQKFTQRLIEECAEHNLILKIHDKPKAPPNGKIRTWPNMVCREYCHSQADAHRSFTPSAFILQAYVNKGTYNATIYRDAPDAHYKTNKEAYRINHRTVTAGDTIEAPMAPGGGHCVMLKPVIEGK